MSTVPTPARYPIPGPPDHRFNDTFVAAVGDLITAYGYPFVDDRSSDFGRLYRYLRGFLYGDDGFGYSREAETSAKLAEVPGYVEGHNETGRSVPWA